MINILYVEDNENDFLIIKEFLEDKTSVFLAYTLYWASSFLEGVEQAKTNQYDVFLVDYRLDKYTGLQFLQEITSLTTPVIYLTGLEDDQISLDAIRLGAADYLIKGKFDSYILKKSIAHSLERKKLENALLETSDRYKELLSSIPSYLNTVSSLAKENESNTVEKLLNKPLSNSEKEVAIRALETQLDRVLKTLYDDGTSLVTRLAIVENRLKELSEEYYKMLDSPYGNNTPGLLPSVYNLMQNSLEDRQVNVSIKNKIDQLDFDLKSLEKNILFLSRVSSFLQSSELWKWIFFIGVGATSIVGAEELIKLIKNFLN